MTISGGILTGPITQPAASTLLSFFQTALSGSPWTVSLVSFKYEDQNAWVWNGSAWEAPAADPVWDLSYEKNYLLFKNTANEVLVMSCPNGTLRDGYDDSFASNWKVNQRTAGNNGSIALMYSPSEGANWADLAPLVVYPGDTWGSNPPIRRKVWENQWFEGEDYDPPEQFDPQIDNTYHTNGRFELATVLPSRAVDLSYWYNGAPALDLVALYDDATDALIFYTRRQSSVVTGMNAVGTGILDSSWEPTPASRIKNWGHAWMWAESGTPPTGTLFQTNWANNSARFEDSYQDHTNWTYLINLNDANQPMPSGKYLTSKLVRGNANIIYGHWAEHLFRVFTRTTTETYKQKRGTAGELVHFFRDILTPWDNLLTPP